MSLDEGSVAHEDRGVWYESMVVGGLVCPEKS